MQKDIDYIIQCMAGWGQCKSMSLTTKAALALVGLNGYAYSGNVPQGVINVMNEARANNMSIDDIILKDNGGWLVIYNDYKNVQGEYIPKQLCKALDYIRENNGHIYSVDWEVQNGSNKPITALYSDLKYYFEDVYSTQNARSFSALWDRGKLCMSILYNNLDATVYNGEREWSVVNGRLVQNGSLQPSHPLYAIVNGIVRSPKHLKLFYGGRYFVSNEDGSHYYYSL